MADPFVPVGFDYAKAMLELRAVMSYDRIAEFCGYASRGQIAKIIAGRVPNHPEGEALYTLYLKTFNRKPPMSESQRTGRFTDVSIRVQHLLSTGA